MFNTYSNNLRHSTECKLVGFADDTNVIRSDKNPNNLTRTMNKDLTNIHSYMTENTLMLNKSKSYFMIFKPKGGKTMPITEKMFINNTVKTLYSEVLNLHYMVNLDEKWSKIFAIW